MKILLTGAAGMLGSSMIPILKEAGHEIYATDKNPEVGVDFLDVRDYGRVLELSTELQPDFIFHLAAETDLEICENDPHYAYDTNTIGTQNVALICKKLRIKMVYICTAGIFDGEKDAFYNEFDEAIPLSVYGKSKYEGEKFVKNLLDEYFIFRPGWMIGGGKKDKKFIGKLIQQIRAGAKEIYAVDDKFGTPTYTNDLSKNILKVVETEFYGVYHAVCRGSASRYDVACEMIRIMNRPDIKVKVVHSDFFAKDYPVNRPQSEMLDNFMLELRGLNQMRNWRDILPEYLEANFSDLINKKDPAENAAIKKKVIILGAGLAGLSCAYKLLQRGAEVVVIEKENAVGGLSRTIRYKNFNFDFSAHRFVGRDKALIEEMKMIMEDNFTRRSKRSRIFMWGHWLNYPFELGNLLIYMPKGLAVMALIDYCRTLVKEKLKPTKIVSFKDWFIASFGHTLYKTNCEPYASKHWRMDPSQIASEWGEARSPASFNLKTIIKDLLTKSQASKLEEDNPYPDADSFYYPKRGGVGAIANRLAEEVRNLGGEIYLSAEAKKIDLQGNKGVIVEFAKDGEIRKISGDLAVSSIPVNKLVESISPAVPENIKTHLSKLRYLNSIFINVIINRQKISDDSWLYFPQSQDEVVFVRAVEFKNWSDTMAPEDKTSLCLDISCLAEESIWQDNNDRELIEKAREGLLKTNIISKAEDMEEAFVIKVPYTYPIYDLSYSKNLKPVIDHLEEAGRLKLLGRTGKFRYYNMDDVIKDGFEVAEEIMSS